MSQKIALVTGASKGLGRAIAVTLAQQGYTVIVHYFNSQAEAKATLQEIQALAPNTNSMIWQANLDEKTDIEKMFAMVHHIFGRLDILVNNVGNYLKKNILELSFDEWQSIMNNNLSTVFYTSQLAIPLMKIHNFGRIINIGFASVGQIKAETMITPYFIAKTGVLLLTKALAKEVAKDHINVHLISPGVLENSLSKPIHEIPKGRTATFDEFCQVLLMLISDESSYLTGTHIEVAGGWRL
jgi:3-oxoacyl-[acyl-carrier protein] reductase